MGHDNPNQGLDNGGFTPSPCSWSKLKLMSMATQHFHAVCVFSAKLMFWGVHQMRQVLMKLTKAVHMVLSTLSVQDTCMHAPISYKYSTRDRSQLSEQRTCTVRYGEDWILTSNHCSLESTQNAQAIEP